MLVFWKEKLAILATPKTASTAIEAALGPLAAVVIQRPKVLKHTDASRFESHWQPYLAQTKGERFSVAALMREPLGWLGSWYRDGQRDGVEPENSTRGISFDAFLQACCQETDRPSYAQIGSQSAFLGFDSADHSKGRVDHLFRYEDLSDFVDFLEDRLNFEIHLPRLNVSPLGDTAITPATEAMVKDIWATDFALYDSLRKG